VSLEISLAGKAAIVTGAGRGIGRAIAEKLSAAGASVLMVDIDPGALQESAAHLKNASAFVGDLTRPEIPDKIVSEAMSRFGALDIVVNNAGYTWDSVIQKTTDEQFQAMLDIHVLTPFRLLRAAAGPIREAAKRESAEGSRVTRKIVNITSISGLDGNPGQAGYASAKAGVVGLTKTLAKEWGRYLVTVNAVAFGLIDTRLTRPMEDPDTAVTFGERHIRVGMQKNVRDEVVKTIPLGRLGTPDDAANAVLFFCCPLSDYVTGETLVCGGGVHF
jgi:3-oxoacyl-[acyl-carrier protein] reductase